MCLLLWKIKNHLKVALRRILRLCLDWSRVAVFDTGAHAWPGSSLSTLADWIHHSPHRVCADYSEIEICSVHHLHEECLWVTILERLAPDIPTHTENQSRWSTGLSCWCGFRFLCSQDWGNACYWDHLVSQQIPGILVNIFQSKISNEARLKPHSWLSLWLFFMVYLRNKAVYHLWAQLWLQNIVDMHLILLHQPMRRQVHSSYCS